MTTLVEQDLAPYLERCFFFEPEEDSYAVEGISGSIPSWLRGTYYANGPARFERGGMRYRHWLDGDGMVCALRFSDEGVHFTNRFVETTKLKQERAEGRFLFRGFGTAFPGDKLRRNLMLEAPVNISAYPYDGRLLAFGEQTLPVALDPVTLESRGEYDFSGKLNEVSPFAAHAKIDPETGRLFNFGIAYSRTNPTLNVYEFDSEGDLVRRRRHRLDMPHSVHDFALSRQHMVFFLSPLLMNFDRFWGEGASVMDSLSWEPDRGSRILVVPREAGLDEAFEVKTGSSYCLHLINGFEKSDRLTVDILELEAPVYPEYQPLPDLFRGSLTGRPVRYVVDIRTREVVSREAMAYDRTPDFAAIDNNLLGRPYDHFWMLGISAGGRQGRKFFDQLAHGSWSSEGVSDVYQTPPGEYLAAEPLCITNPDDPEEAVVIIEHIDAKQEQAAFLLFEAEHVAAGPIVRLPLRCRIHPLFHTSFSRRL